MNEERKDKWVDALRSGKYKQGRLCLRSSDNCFCCLGVLCDIVDPEGWQLGVFTYMGEQSRAYLPDRLSYKLDMEFLEHDLIRMNDAGKSFEEIANYIEKHVETKS